MLNYVWLSLILLGIGTALTTDIINSGENKFHNGDKIVTNVHFLSEINLYKSKTYEARLSFSKDEFNNFYNAKIDSDLSQSGKITFIKLDNEANLILNVDKSSPKIWQEMAESSGDKNELFGKLFLGDNNTASEIKGEIVFEKISFVKMKDITNSSLSIASEAVKIALGLIGIMALWLGVMKVAEEAGLISLLARLLKPVMKRLFPEIPSDHPAIGSMIMNISANMLGLGNAATPFGLKAMEEMEKLNPNKGVASNSMVTFLAINTAGLTLIPATAIAVRAAAGSSNPAIIIGTSIFGATCATIAGVSAAKLIEKFSISGLSFSEWYKSNLHFFTGLILAAILLSVLFFTGLFKDVLSVFSFLSFIDFKGIIETLSVLAIPFLILIFIGYGAIKKVRVYETFVEGAKEGFNIAVKIIPYLVAMLVGIAIFRSGGAMELLIKLLNPITSAIGMPAEALPMALMRPLSGSGSLGIMAENLSVYGPDSFIGILVSTFFGSTETTFYVLAVYFGAVNIRNTRHALPVGLFADICGILGALFIVKLLFS
jgi:spore maturation protein SpmA